jgi:protein TonB
MLRLVISSCVFLACAGVAHAAPTASPPPAKKAAACSTPELLFNGIGPRPGIAAPHSLKFPLRPQYPESLGRNGPSGMVWVDFIVERDGRLCNVMVRSVDGPKQFADITSAWLANSPFAPATRNGKPVVSEVKRPINFIAPGQRH